MLPPMVSPESAIVHQMASSNFSRQFLGCGGLVSYMSASGAKCIGSTGMSDAFSLAPYIIKSKKKKEQISRGNWNCAEFLS